MEDTTAATSTNESNILPIKNHFKDRYCNAKCFTLGDVEDVDDVDVHVKKLVKDLLRVHS